MFKKKYTQQDSIIAIATILSMLWIIECISSLADCGLHSLLNNHQSTI